LCHIHVSLEAEFDGGQPGQVGNQAALTVEPVLGSRLVNLFEKVVCNQGLRLNFRLRTVFFSIELWHVTSGFSLNVEVKIQCKVDLPLATCTEPNCNEIPIGLVRLHGKYLPQPYCTRRFPAQIETARSAGSDCG
jgi:hypothetical protein